MFASDELIKALNKQVGNELQASLQYTSIACHLANQTMPELASVFFQQADEERDHAMKFVHFIIDVDGKVELPALEAPQNTFSSVEECLELSVESEKTVTVQINELVNLASGESNHVALRFLDFFVEEQLEEVNKMTDLLTMIRRAGEERIFWIEDYLSRKAPSAG